MRVALSLARRGLGSVAPNPSVGCVLVRDGRVVGRGWTQPSGRPHAETEALKRAGDGARGATAYVTLEPCCHHGMTPPCTDALIAAGIARVVIGVEDPDERVRGRGVEHLVQAGIQVEIGVLDAEAAALNQGFFLAKTIGRPMVTWKAAVSLDGRVATAGGQSKWITGDVARAYAHALRADHDAIIVGIETALADDPELTCRLPGLSARSPLRVVFDRRVRLPVTSRLARSARDVPVLVFAAESAISDDQGVARVQSLRDCGVDVVPLAGKGSTGDVIDPWAVLRVLASRGITRILLEGGPRLVTSFLSAGLIDEIHWVASPKILGADGLGAVGGLGLGPVPEQGDFQFTATRKLGSDVLWLYRRSVDAPTTERE